MKSLSIAIIDDEADARFLLRRALEESFADQIEYLAEADSVYSGQELLRTQQIDLLFLDIQLTDGTGFNLLENLTQIDFTIVFVTAHNNFALRAFNFFTFAYLVKPFKNSELVRVVDRYLERRLPPSQSSVRVLSETMTNRRISKVVIAELEGFRVIELTDIAYLKSDSNYTEFVLTNGERTVGSKTLKEFEVALQTERFFRIHRSYLVNLHYVQAYSKHGGGTVIMQNGDELPIGRRRLAAFRELFLG